MKKLVFSLALATLFIACDNAGTTADTKDSLDSIASEKKEAIDSSAEERKESIDSTTEQKKETLDKLDSLNREQDSVSR